MKYKSAIKKINEQGILLVFPINNKKEPDSIWQQFYPRTKMKWDWNEDGDDKVADMWYLMKKLSDCREVVYSKWYQNRATFFSKKLFTAMLCVFQKSVLQDLHLSPVASQIYETLLESSPLSTKQLKEITELQGKLNEPLYAKACKELFHKLIVIAYGEVQDGAFPSLAIGATKTLFEDLWREAEEMQASVAEEIIDQYMPKGSLTRKFFDKTRF